MRILSDFTGAELDRDLVVTVGTYDGLHRGHQHLVRALVAHAREIDALSGLITFHPCPRRVLHPELPTMCLTTPDEKRALLEEMGLDVLVELHFTPEMSRTPAREFVRAAVEHLRVRELWVGAGFALGRHREGDVAGLRGLAQELGFELQIIEMMEDDGEPVSSTRIRSLILQGRVDKAAELLGRFFGITGETIPGRLQGRCAGLSSFNLSLRAECLLPASGTYAAYALVGKQRYPAVLDTATPSDANDDVRAVQVHLLAPGRDLGGQQLVVRLVQRLRTEHYSDTEGHLGAQIGRDIRQVERMLGVGCGKRSGPEEWGGMAQGEVKAKRFEELEHTADVALRVYGRDMQELFVHAAEVMFSLIGDCERDAAPRFEMEIRLEGPDRESLLIDWLNELLYLFETKSVHFFAFDIRELTTTSLEARVCGGPLTLHEKAIKAATFHDLHISETSEGLEVTVVFDI